MAWFLDVSEGFVQVKLTEAPNKRGEWLRLYKLDDDDWRKKKEAHDCI